MQMNLGERVRKRRGVLGITQQQLADALGITPQHISFIEQDKGAPSLELLPKLAEALGVTTDFLLTGKEGGITSVIPAIKADKTLRPAVKKALIVLMDELYKPSAEKPG